MRNDDRMVILPANDDGALLDTLPWHRAAADEGWMQYQGCKVRSVTR